MLRIAICKNRVAAGPGLRPEGAWGMPPSTSKRAVSHVGKPPWSGSFVFTQTLLATTLVTAIQDLLTQGLRSLP